VPLLRLHGRNAGRGINSQDEASQTTAADAVIKDALGGCGAWVSVADGWVWTPLPAVAPQHLPGFHATKEPDENDFIPPRERTCQAKRRAWATRE
jgi:hypothetical protein